MAQISLIRSKIKISSKLYHSKLSTRYLRDQPRVQFASECLEILTAAWEQKKTIPSNPHMIFFHSELILFDSTTNFWVAFYRKQSPIDAITFTSTFVHVPWMVVRFRIIQIRLMFDQKMFDLFSWVQKYSVHCYMEMLITYFFISNSGINGISFSFRHKRTRNYKSLVFTITSI